MIAPQGCISRSHGRSVHLIKKEKVRWTINTGPLHGLTQILRLHKLANLIQIFHLKENHDFIGIIGASEDITPFGTECLSCGAVLIEHWLPFGILLDFMLNYYVWHSLVPPFNLFHPLGET